MATPSLSRESVSSQAASACLAGSLGARLHKNTMSVTTLVPSRWKALEGRRMAPRNSARPALAHEIADPTARLKNRGLGGNAEPAEGIVHRGDDRRGGVEGIEGAAPGAIVFLRREQRLQLLAEGLPRGILVAAGNRVRKD